MNELFLRCYTCVTPLDTMPRRELVHISVTETQQISTNGIRARLRIAGKTGDQYIEAMSKVCDGLRGDAFVAAQEVGFDNLCEIVAGIPPGIDTLINHMRGMVFFQIPKNYSDRSVVAEDPCPDKMEKI